MRNHWLFFVHKHLALLFSLPLLLLALSGCLIALSPHEKPSKAAYNEPLATLMDKVKASHPNATFMRGMTRGPGGQTAHLLARLSHGPRMIWSEGDELVVRDLSNDFFFQNKHFHESFLLHGPGKKVVAISGLALTVVLLSGLLFWAGPQIWKRTRRLWRDSPRRLAAWHVVAGLVFVLPLTFQAVTGSLIELHPLVTSEAVLRLHETPLSCNYVEQKSFVLSHPELAMVFFCRPDFPYFLVRTRAGMAQFTPKGEEVAAGDALSRKGFFLGLHGANFMGPLEHSYNVVMGVALSFFIISGLTLWARKKFRRREYDHAAARTSDGRPALGAGPASSH